MRIEPWQRNLAALFFAQTLTMIAFSFVFPFIPLYIRSLGVSDPDRAAEWAGLVMAAAALSMAVAQPYWGSLADRMGRKPMVIRSMLGGSVIIGAMGFVSSPEQLLVLRFIQGAITGVVAAGNALVATSTPKPRLGFALGLMQVSIFLGNSVGPLVGGVISDEYGFRVAFYAAASLLLLGGLIAIAFVHEQFVRPAANAARPSVIAESRSLLGISIFPVLVTVVFLIQLGGTIISPVLSLFIAQLSTAADVATEAGLVMAATGAVSALSAIVIGRLSDRVGHAMILPICLLGAAAAYVPQAWVENVGQLLLWRMLLGVFLGGLMPSANALIALIVPVERRGAAYGLSATASSLANGVGPLAGAAIATTLTMRDVFLATGLLFTVGLVWVVFSLRGFKVAQLPTEELAAARREDSPAYGRTPTHGTG